MPRILPGIICAFALLNVAPAQRMDTIRVGSRALNATGFLLGTDTVDGFELSGGKRKATNTTIRSITLEQYANEHVYLMRAIDWTPAGDSTWSSTIMRVSDFSLVHHKVKGSHDSAAVTTTSSQLTAWVVLPPKPIVLLDLVLERPVFPLGGQVPWLLTMLPLAPGYQAVVPEFSEWDGREVWKHVDVLDVEKITVHNKTYECWKVDTGPIGPPGYHMYRWIDKASRRIIQSVLRGGMTGTEYWSVLRL